LPSDNEFDKEAEMTRNLLLVPVAAAFLLAAGPAGATQCPTDMRAIDQALASAPGLDAKTEARVMTLRKKGEELHESGKHAQSVAVLAEAKRLLGIGGKSEGGMSKQRGGY
jgi:hypothetical protein